MNSLCLASMLWNSFLFILWISIQVHNWCAETRVHLMEKALWIISKRWLISHPVDCFKMSYLLYLSSQILFMWYLAYCLGRKGKSCVMFRCVWFPLEVTVPQLCTKSISYWQLSRYSCFWQLLFVLCMKWEGLLDESREK